ncbi:LPS assembly lipoprotein LptE [Halorhodospira neutriphila]|uniref:LPS-assembly lipoprotein LptE n=1 Tax=Halorhodospira neutriphila TaxID=168379 RepID=A0ABS1E3Y2_9GAMM|nr:LPS assembly lipoprotein LptE [Halorhodospira neutriphila]MBK1725485.1 hypothetical protein [Halorhodospira neutriphila]
MRRLGRLALVALLAGALSACGWQLRGGSGGLSLDGQAVQVVDEAGSAALRRAVRSGVEGAGGRLASGPEAADLVLTLHGQGSSREAVSVGVSEGEREYRLRYRIDYSVREPGGEALIARETAGAERRFTDPAGGADQRRSREAELAAELRDEAVQMLMLRLQAL